MTPTPSTRRTTARLGGLVAAGLLALTACGTSAAAPAADPPSPAPAGDGTPHDLTTRDVDAWLDGFLPAALEREGVQGATVAVVDDGRVVTTRGFGWSDVEDETPVDPADTLFRVGSVSKVFTATAVMQLVEDGDVDLDTDVQDYVDADLGLDRPVTLRHLLTHTGGFEEKVSGLIGGPDATVDLERALTTDPPEQVYEPGTTPAYSNHGNALAGLVVQEVSGRPFEQYVADEVLAPLGMDSSSFAQPLPEGLADRLASGYAGPDAEPTPFETVGTAPAGALTSSADDMARFMLAQLGASDTPLMEPATLEQMHAPALDADDLGGLAAGSRMTLGWFDRSQNGHRVVEHGGDTTVFHSDLALWPDDGAGIFVSLSGSGAEATSTLELRDGLVEGFGDRYLPGDEPAPADLSPEQVETQAAAMTGTYESSRTVRSNFLTAMYALGHTTVTDAGEGRLLVSPGPNRAGPSLMEPVGDWTWREVDGDRVIAARTTGGEDPEVTAIGYDSAFTLLPVTAAHSPAMLTVAGASGVVLAGAAVGALLMAPVTWLRRRRRATDEERTGRRAGRTLRVLSRVGVVAAVLALVGWGLTVTSVMTFGEPGAWQVRQVQLLQLVGLLGVVPAVLRVLDEARRRAGWWRVAASALVALALVGVGWTAVALHLLSPDITY